MNNLNSIIIEGNLTQDAESKTINNNLLFSFSFACNRWYKQDDEFKNEVSYFNGVAWGKTADWAVDKLKKGVGVRIIGRLKQKKWTGEDGKVKSSVVIIADRIETNIPKKQESDFSEDI